MTEKQELARSRNWQKARLINYSLDERSLTPLERQIYNNIKILKKNLLDGWDYESMQLGLTVKPKCWCGKVGKYKPDILVYPGLVNKEVFVCKKHINNKD